MTSPAGGGRGTVNAFEGLPSPLEAVDDLRAAAKWTLAAEGAVGAALISGGPLVAVGQVHGVARALVAGAGLAVALGGVGLAIWFTSKVLSPRLTTPATLRSPALAGLRRVLEADPAQFFGVVATKVDALLLHQEVAVDLARKAGAEKDTARRQVIKRQLRRAEANAARAAPYVRWLLSLAHVWQIEADLRRSRWAALAGGLLVVAGAVLFFIAAGGLRPAYRSGVGRLEGRGEQVAGGQAAVRPPLLGDRQDLLLAGQVVELVAGPDGLTERQVARQHDVFAAESDEQGTLDRPRAYPGDGSEHGDDLVIGQAAQRLLVQAAVREPFGEVAEGADLPPGQPGLAELGRLYAKQLDGGREMAAEQGLDAGHGPAGRRHGQLLAGDLEQQGAEQVHRRQLGYPRPGIEVRPLVDEPGQYRIGAVQVGAGGAQPRGAAGILGHRIAPFARGYAAFGYVRG
jgi:hypothetical protein